MTHRSRSPLLIGLAALSIGFALVAPAQAQYRGDTGSSTSATLQITFRSTPRWTAVPGTNVQSIDPQDRSDYDMFRYGNDYYVYDNDRWYMSHQYQGQFNLIEDRYVPNDFANVPRERWRNYPSTWQNRQYQQPDRQYQQPNRSSTSLQITFRSAPRWTAVPGTNVQSIYPDDRSDYDMFRYGNDYYVYDNDRWYMSHSYQGQFDLIDDRSVPNDFTNIPRDRWQNYPSTWQDRQRQRPDRGPMTLQVNIRYAPRWVRVRGTRVEEMASRGRWGYDMFRYAGVYYVYSDYNWYASRQWRGTFSRIDGRNAPRELALVPRDHWRNYPQAWMDANPYPRNGNGRWGRR